MQQNARFLQKLSLEESQQILKILKTRFEKNLSRHKNLEWSQVQARLEENPQKLWSLNEMEKTGGEPDLTGLDEESGALIFMDCAAESPLGRRSLCYDRQALDSRKTAKPSNSVMDLASAMGVSLLSEEEYRCLQKRGPFDTKTSSWLLTPAEIRRLGGAIFGDCRYGRIFTYHNSADSYYSSRGFRASLKV
ncbi:MAG: DUF4256 domain-containing protein [Anaerolineaceae bacterium]|nr:DUF4256 domain-containing protein [Anaerolineaceae bacterium]